MRMSQVLVIVLFLPLLLFIAPARAEEPDPQLQGEEQKHQLVGLIGTWEFTLDLSLTYGMSLKPKKMVYEIVTVDGTIVQSLAFGLDPKDKSEFAVSVRPEIVYGQKYNFSMFDVDMMAQLPTCFQYAFSQAGRYILGYVWMHAAKQGEEAEKDGPCGGSDLIAVGIVTGERISIGEEKSSRRSN